MEIIGKVYKVLPMITGQGAKGEWKKRELVIETEDQYPKKVHFTLFGEERVAILDNIALGEQVKVYFSPESREWNERWYTDLRCFRIDRFAQTGAGAPMQAPPPMDTPPPAEAPASTPVEEDNDLPF